MPWLLALGPKAAPNGTTSFLWLLLCNVLPGGAICSRVLFVPCLPRLLLDAPPLRASGMLLMRAALRTLLLGITICIIVSIIIIILL